MRGENFNRGILNELLGEPVRKTLEDRKKEYRIIFELLGGKPRINVKEVASILDSDRHSASNRLKEAFTLGYVLRPQVRKRSYQNMEEYMYFMQCDNPLDTFEKYGNDESVMYRAVMGGPVNFWMITTEERNIDDDVVVKGLRSDYYVAVAPEITWDDSITRIHAKINEFDPETYSPQKKIQTHWNEFIEWDEEDEKIFDAFQYDLRRKLTPIMKENLISGEKIYKWLDRLNETCTMYTQFFPEGISNYDPYVLMVDTPYEDFIIDLFSQFPTSTMFFRVHNHLFCYISVRKTCVKKVTGPLRSIEDLEVPYILRVLEQKRYIENWWYSSVEYYCHK